MRLIHFRSLLACFRSAVFIGLSESFSALLIASFLDWIPFAFFFHEVESNPSSLVRQAELRPALVRLGGLFAPMDKQKSDTLQRRSAGL